MKYSKYPIPNYSRVDNTSKRPSQFPRKSHAPYRTHSPRGKAAEVFHFSAAIRRGFRFRISENCSRKKYACPHNVNSGRIAPRAELFIFAHSGWRHARIHHNNADGVQYVQHTPRIAKFIFMRMLFFTYKYSGSPILITEKSQNYVLGPNDMNFWRLSMSPIRVVSAFPFVAATFLRCYYIALCSFVCGKMYVCMFWLIYSETQLAVFCESNPNHRFGGDWIFDLRFFRFSFMCMRARFPRWIFNATGIFTEIAQLRISAFIPTFQTA